MSLDTPNSQKPHQPLVFFQLVENDVFPQSAAVLLTAGGKPFPRAADPRHGKTPRRGWDCSYAVPRLYHPPRAVGQQLRSHSCTEWGERGTACPCPASLHTTVPQCATGYVQDRGWKKKSMTPSAGNQWYIWERLYFSWLRSANQ